MQIGKKKVQHADRYKKKFGTQNGVVHLYTPSLKHFSKDFTPTRQFALSLSYPRWNRQGRLVAAGGELAMIASTK
jgi:hypothetical protein